jgi:hypothetical protein
MPFSVAMESREFADYDIVLAMEFRNDLRDFPFSPGDGS